METSPPKSECLKRGEPKEKKEKKEKKHKSKAEDGIHEENTHVSKSPT